MQKDKKIYNANEALNSKGNLRFEYFRIIIRWNEEEEKGSAGACIFCVTLSSYLPNEQTPPATGAVKIAVGLSG